MISFSELILLLNCYNICLQCKKGKDECVCLDKYSSTIVKGLFVLNLTGKMSVIDILKMRKAGSFMDCMEDASREFGKFKEISQTTCSRFKIETRFFYSDRWFRKAEEMTQLLMGCRVDDLISQHIDAPLMRVYDKNFLFNLLGLAEISN